MWPKPKKSGESYLLRLQTFIRKLFPDISCALRQCTIKVSIHFEIDPVKMQSGFYVVQHGKLMNMNTLNFP